jgi:hypothetical protein
MKTLIKNGFVIDPGNSRIGKYDLLIEYDKITSIDVQICSKADQVIDASGKFVTPGFIDLQVNPGQTIEKICQILPFQGITTPLIMPCNIYDKSFLDHYGSIENVLSISHGLPVNVANAISMQPFDTHGHETYSQFAIAHDAIKSRLEALADLNVIAVGEVVLPIQGVAHIDSQVGESFLQHLLTANETVGLPILLHTGLGKKGILRAVEIANGRPLHICHVGSTTAQDNIHEVLSKISHHSNITTDTHLSEFAGVNSYKSELVIKYLKEGQVVTIDPITLEPTLLTELESADPPYYYTKPNLFENNMICALSDGVDAIESDELGDGVRSAIMIKNFFNLINAVSLNPLKIQMMARLIKKMTCNPAKILKLKKRGSLGLSQYADINIIDLNQETIDTVLVNGQVVLLNGQLTGASPGVCLSLSQ